MLEVQQGRARGLAGVLGRMAASLAAPTVHLATTDSVSVLIVKNGRAERTVRLGAGDHLRLTARGLSTLQVEYGTSEEEEGT